MSSLFSGLTCNAVMDDMDRDIKEGCRNASAYRPLLSQFSPEPVWPGLARTETYMKLHLQQIWSAQETIKQLESRQLRVVADFLETYPNMLRWTHDPRGDASTTPPVHNVRKLRLYAKKVFNTQYVRRHKPVHCSVAFRNGIVPIVPRNWCLQLLLGSDMSDEVVEGIRKQWIGLEDLTDALQHTRVAPSSKQRPPSPPFAALPFNPAPTSLTVQCPPAPPVAAASQQSSPESREYAITEDLRTVVEGLTHRYVRPDHMIDGTPIARIATTDGRDISNWFMKSSEERKQIIEHGHACFVTPSRAELSQRAETVAIKKDGLKVWGKRAKANLHVQPYHLQELEWLGAFLRSVAYLKKKEERA